MGIFAYINLCNKTKYKMRTKINNKVMILPIVATLISTSILIHILFCCAPKASYYFHRSVLLRMFEMLLMSVWYYLLLINIRNGKDLIMSVLFLFLLFFFLCRNGDILSYFSYKIFKTQKDIICTKSIQINSKCFRTQLN